MLITQRILKLRALPDSLANNFLPQKYAEYLGLGAEIAVSLIIPILTGYYLDKYFDTSPVLILIGVLLAMIGFGFTIARITKKLDQGDNE